MALNLKMFRVAYLGIAMNLSKLNHSNEMNRLSKSDSKLNSRFKFSTPSGKRNFETFWIWTHFPRFGFSKVNMSSTTVLKTTLHLRRNNFWTSHWRFMLMAISTSMTKFSNWWHFRKLIHHAASMIHAYA